MNFNPLIIPTLILALLLFWGGQTLFVRTPRGWQRAAFLAGCVLATIPGVLMAVYYLHLLDNAAWFYAFRTAPVTELTAAGAGLLAGALSSVAGHFRIVTRPFLLAVLILGIAMPYLKPVRWPLAQNQLHESWDGEVCRQSSMSTCGPASAATLFKVFGVEVTEIELAHECHSYAGGTEVWYLARAFRKRGFDVQFRCDADLPVDLPSPAIAGVRGGGFGHFIPILGRTATGGIVTGDPLYGRREHTPERITRDYKFTGFFMIVRRR